MTIKSRIHDIRSKTILEFAPTTKEKSFYLLYCGSKKEIEEFMQLLEQQQQSKRR